MVVPRRQSTRDGEDNQECVDRSIVRFRASFSRRLDLLHSLLVGVGVLFVPEETKRARHAYSSTRVSISISRRAIASRRFVFLYSLTSRRFLSLSNNTVCCIGAGYVGGPTMAMIALKCPHIEVNREHVSRQVFARFIMTSSSNCIRLQNAGVQNVSVFDTPPGPGGAIFSTRARRNRRREQSETNDWSRW